MEFELTDAQRQVAERARAVAEAELLPGAAEADRLERFPDTAVAKLGEHGYLGMLVPAEYGGAEAGAVAYSLALTEVARCCASSAVTMAVTNMVADAICAFGTEAQKKRWVPELVSGQRVAGAFALSEPGAGSDAASLSTIAKRDGDGYVLDGTKCWITSGEQAGVSLIMAKTDPAARARGISAFLLEPGMDGFSVGRHEQKMGLRGSSTVTLNLDAVRVPEDHRLGPEGVGFKIAMRALDGGRIGIGSQATGLHLACLEASQKYVAARKRLASSQAIQWKLADMATELDAARLLVLRAAWMKDNSLPFTQEASMAKLFATESANKAALDAVEIHGGLGHTAEFSVERHLRDVRVSTIYEGTSEVQRLVIARQLLRD